MSYWSSCRGCNWYVPPAGWDSSYIAIVDVPYAGNPNLAAQNGRFTLAIKRHSSEAILKPLDQIFRDICVEAEQLGVAKRMVLGQGFDTATAFTKFTLPASRSADLLNRLFQLGYNRARFFPGYAGCKEIIDEALAMRKHVKFFTQRSILEPEE